MSVQVQEILDRATRRAEWSARALQAAAQELLAAGEEGALVDGTAAETRAEAERCGERAQRIAADRKLTGSGRRVRDGL